MGNYDIIIVGAGPAGIFAALELAAENKYKILILEKGKNITQRHCPRKGEEQCYHCSNCSIVSGWGGAGAFSDGKLTLTTEFGGWLDEYQGKSEVQKLIDYADDIYCRFGAPEKTYGTDLDEIRDIQRQAARADLALIPAPIRHLGTDKCHEILKDMRDYLGERVEIRTSTKVEHILVENGSVAGVEIEGGAKIPCKYVITAPGREGSEWFAREALRLGLKTKINPVDIGVRVELPAPIFDHITDVVYESKFIFHSKFFDDRVRTFCMSPHGEVVVENNFGLLTVNGHSYAQKKTNNTNFALLVSKTFTEPFKEPISYGKHIASLANLLGGGVIVQRLGDLLSGRRSTAERIERGMVEPTLKDATPGDLSLVLPYRHLVSILEMLEALDVVAPGANSRHTLLYGIEAKFYSSRLKLSRVLESQVANLFAAGDGAGVTRGLIQASAAGVVAAREILRREA
ncbi:MAG: NAD(P)/FAD-dependent oxidoreductase [Firmicutes bacterium]|nr:NAD(P)/FAD-dependent oxidoreductase [Bacillota bacterium]